MDDTTQEGAALPGNPPRENLVRDVPNSIELRDVEGSSMPVMRLRYAPFNEWTNIQSSWEGNFMERIAPGATLKTIAEVGRRMKIQFNHGKDPAVGGQLLGIPEDLREEEDGGWADVPLFDTSYNRDLLPGLRAGAYGASFRFKVMREDFNKKPERSEWNPDGLPERTIQEMRLEELGPVSFPAYAGTQVGVRSGTDEFILRSLFAEPERIKAILEANDFANYFVGGHFAPSTPAPAEATQESERRESKENRFNTREEYLKWLTKS